MIWFNENLQVPNQPAGATVALVGQFLQSHDSTPPITIRLQFQRADDETLTQITLFTHQPSGVNVEDPSPEDILEKYRGKIIKAKKRITDTPFELLTTVRPLA